MTPEEVLFKDYENTQSFINKADGFLFWIRNWTIIMCSAVIAFAVTKHCPAILVANVFILLGFVFIELIQKSFHEDAIGHGYNIECIIQKSILSDEPFPDDYQFGLGHAIKPVKPLRMIVILFNSERWHIAAFYILILIFSLGTFFIMPLVPAEVKKENPTVIQYFENERPDKDNNSGKQCPRLSWQLHVHHGKPKTFSSKGRDKLPR